MTSRPSFVDEEEEEWQVGVVLEPTAGAHRMESGGVSHIKPLGMNDLSGPLPRRHRCARAEPTLSASEKLLGHSSCQASACRGLRAICRLSSVSRYARQPPAYPPHRHGEPRYPPRPYRPPVAYPRYARPYQGHPHPSYQHPSHAQVHPSHHAMPQPAPSPGYGHARPASHAPHAWPRPQYPRPHQPRPHMPPGYPYARPHYPYYR